MIRKRNVLHQSKVQEFLSWAESQSYRTLPVRGDYEAFRIETPTKGLLLIAFKRRDSDHITTTGHLTILVDDWIRSRELPLRYPACYNNGSQSTNRR